MRERRIDDATVSRVLLGTLGSAPAGLARRARGRALATVAALCRPASRWVLVAAAAAVVVAAAVPVVLLSGSDELVVALEATGGRVLAEPAPGVRLEFDGVGTVGGEPEDVQVAWESGAVHVELDPAAGAHVAVSTREATAVALGTGFTVRRSERGTAVSVSHGRVEVTCSRGGQVVLEAHQSTTCGPVSPASLMGLAQFLVDGGAPADEVLGVVDRALAGAPDASHEAELRITRLEALLSAERLDEAHTEAGRYLAGESTPRRVEVQRLMDELESR